MRFTLMSAFFIKQAILGLETGIFFVFKALLILAAIGLSALFVDQVDLSKNFLVLYSSFGGLTFQPSVISTSAYFEGIAHLLIGVYSVDFLYKLEYLPSFLEKMLTVFFRISLSIPASFKAFFKRVISASSGVGLPITRKATFFLVK